MSYDDPIMCQCCGLHLAQAWTPDQVEKVCYRCGEHWTLHEDWCQLGVAWAGKDWRRVGRALWAGVRLLFWVVR